MPYTYATIPQTPAGLSANNAAAAAAAAGFTGLSYQPTAAQTQTLQEARLQ